MKRIPFLFILFLNIFCFGQEKEYYRFSYDYFVDQVEISKANKKYFFKKDTAWLEISLDVINEKKIDNFIDWKITQNGEVDKGAFTEEGIYRYTKDEEYEKLKQKWKHQYYKPIWEIKVRELQLNLKYETGNLIDNDVSDKVFDIPENSAEFPGGQSKMYIYFAKSFKLHEEYKVSSGTKVFVMFIIHENGEIGNVEIIRGIDEMVDSQVLRVLKEMPNWIPARQKGKCVTSRVIIPIQFEVK